MKIAIWVCLFTGFLLLFYRLRRIRLWKNLLMRTKSGMEEATRQRLLSDRSRLKQLQRENSLWFYLERELNYSGWKRLLGGLTVEGWLLFQVAASAALFLAVILLPPGFWGAVLSVLIFWVAEWLLLTICKARMLKSVNANLLKFLDFLGNYSLTAGEVTSVFGQISRYVEEPLKSALDECCYEAQTTGDVGMALLSMAEKIEHPKFKELVRNIEISTRYCADFSVLVNASRRSVREYLRMGEERKGMLREAVINMLLLCGMSLVVFLVVDRLIETSIWLLLWKTIPGKLAFTVIASIFLLFGRQIYKIYR